jgi:hypothetical protein
MNVGEQRFVNPDVTAKLNEHISILIDTYEFSAVHFQHIDQIAPSWYQGATSHASKKQPAYIITMHTSMRIMLDFVISYVSD